ncbi:unnamed protein product [Blepharisma stoltei]|uniref:Uncharacterized protein n=1 Tax=Blepharisma stoltei TaxID=1481888 RepID=A0AAU9IGW2_9CILI|nr:unnamed protein product [Blepharisma stoltei]
MRKELILTYSIIIMKELYMVISKLITSSHIDYQEDLKHFESLRITDRRENSQTESGLKISLPLLGFDGPETPTSVKKIDIDALLQSKELVIKQIDQNIEGRKIVIRTIPKKRAEDQTEVFPKKRAKEQQLRFPINEIEDKICVNCNRWSKRNVYLSENSKDTAKKGCENINPSQNSQNQNGSAGFSHNYSEAKSTKIARICPYCFKDMNSFQHTAPKSVFDFSYYKPL